MKFSFALFLLTTAVALGCNGSPVGPSDITGQSWRLLSLREGTSDPIVISDPSRYTLRLTNEGRVEVKSDCNSCGGQYSLNGSALDIGPLVCTRAFCGTESLDAEYTRALDNAQSLTLNDDILTIFSDGVTLRFER